MWEGNVVSLYYDYNLKIFKLQYIGIAIWLGMTREHLQRGLRQYGRTVCQLALSHFPKLNTRLKTCCPFAHLQLCLFARFFF